MRKHFVNHDNLRRHLAEFEKKGEDVSDETLNMLLGELQHSCLIIAGDVSTTHQMAMFNHDGKRYGFLFTDMDEFRKFDPNSECPSEACDFEVYKTMVESGDADGFVLNPLSEGFIIIREIFKSISHLPQHDYPPEGSYTSFELRDLRDSMDNRELEDFLNDSSNIGRYEELFARISGSDLNKYSQIVNFSQLTNYALNDGLDGIIINPNCENVMISREVLLEYWSVLEEFCNDSKLNTAIKHMFLIKEEA